MSEGSEANSDAKKRSDSALRLLDYAIAANLSVPDRVIDALYAARSETTFPDGTARFARRPELDKAIRDLTELTYPTTIESIGATPSGSSFPRFVIFLLGVALLLLFLGAFASDADTKVFSKAAQHATIVISLGALGALTYIFFNLIGILSEKAFNPSDNLANALRVVVGAIVGWALSNAYADPNQTQTGIITLLPFLAGFSTRLVVGLLNQAIRAVELTLGLEDQGTELVRRKARQRSAQRERSSYESGT
ncbi:MAG: hypothetical protein HY040_06420 [Planctomycetes bacterium]|nr:hypothetical protein [Planctomycetota bacterium]